MRGLRMCGCLAVGVGGRRVHMRWATAQNLHIARGFVVGHNVPEDVGPHDFERRLNLQIVVLELDREAVALKLPRRRVRDGGICHVRRDVRGGDLVGMLGNNSVRACGVGARWKGWQGTGFGGGGVSMPGRPPP